MDTYPKLPDFYMRGCRFYLNGKSFMHDLSTLYLVFKALDGDELAKEILDTAKVTINDADGNRIYPPKG